MTTSRRHDVHTAAVYGAVRRRGSVAGKLIRACIPFSLNAARRVPITSPCAAALVQRPASGARRTRRVALQAVVRWHTHLNCPASRNCKRQKRTSARFRELAPACPRATDLSPGFRPLIPLKAGADYGPFAKEGRKDQHQARYTHTATISALSSGVRSQRIEIKAGLNFLSFLPGTIRCR